MGAPLVTEASIVERLLAHRLLKSAPREQLEWLAAHGTLERFEPGDTVSKKLEPIPALYVVLSGLLSIHVDHGAGPRRVTS